MPRKAETEAATKKTAATKTKSKAQSKAKTKTTAATKDKTKSATETPKHSEVILDYNRFGNIGFSHVHETVDISFLTKKKLTGEITTLFHFLRNTPVTSNRDSGRTATFTIDYKPVISIVQKAGDYENQVFTLTKYKPDGSKQSTRRYSYIKTKNLILDAFGFETKIDEDEDAEQPEESENSNEDMKMLPESGNIENDIDSGFSNVEQGGINYGELCQG